MEVIFHFVLELLHSLELEGTFESFESSPIMLVECCAQSHTVGKYQRQDLNLDPDTRVSIVCHTVLHGPNVSVH